MSGPTGSEARPATVVSVSPLSVVLNGSSSPLPAVTLGTYSPSIGDNVAVIEYDVSATSKRLLVLGGAGLSGPLGVVFYDRFAAWTSITGTSETALSTMTNIGSTDLVAGRYYRVTAKIAVVPVAAALTTNMTARVRIGSGLTGLAIAHDYEPQASTLLGMKPSDVIACETSGGDVTPGVTTFTVSLQNGTSTTTASLVLGSDLPSLLVEDIGAIPT